MLFSAYYCPQAHFSYLTSHFLPANISFSANYCPQHLSVFSANNAFQYLLISFVIKLLREHISIFREYFSTSISVSVAQQIITWEHIVAWRLWTRINFSVKICLWVQMDQMISETIVCRHMCWSIVLPLIRSLHSVIWKNEFLEVTTMHSIFFSNAYQLYHQTMAWALVYLLFDKLLPASTYQFANNSLQA